MHPLDKFKKIKSKMTKEIGQHQHRRRIKKPSKQTREYWAKNGIGHDAEVKPKNKYSQYHKIIIEPDTTLTRMVPTWYEYIIDFDARDIK